MSTSDKEAKDKESLLTISAYWRDAAIYAYLIAYNGALSEEAKYTRKPPWGRGGLSRLVTYECGKAILELVKNGASLDKDQVKAITQHLKKLEALPLSRIKI